ncbi:Nn.00g013870.m01.CDS01 [Neocucurbitaria sp. VM-36]
MRKPNECRVVLLLIPSLFLLFPIGVLILVLERISSSLLLAQTVRNSRTGAYEITLYGPTSSGSNEFTNSDVTLRISQAPTLAILGVCVIAYIVSALAVFGMWDLRRVEGTANHQRMWSWLILVSNFIMIGASVGVLAYASSIQSNDKAWQRYEDVVKDDQEFTRETWSCQIDQFYPSQNWARSACGTAKATRFLLIPMAIASMLVIVSMCILIHTRGGIKWLSGGKGRYGGFDSIYEMQPTTPSAPYVPQAIPQWSPQPAQPWIAQPVQQWTPQQPIAYVVQPGVVADQRIGFK